VVSGALRRAVFLDRDGVINRAVVRGGKPYPPDSLAELEILPGVNEALKSLRSAGFLNVIVTNQPDVATGKQQRAVVDAMHSKLLQELPIDAVKVCFHSDADRCVCRKPKPGMLVEASRELDIDLARSFLVGDRWRDISAAQAAGCAALFIDYGYEEKQPEKPYLAVKSLPDAAGLILKSGRQSGSQGGQS
jgi:D-glycero-D-manno-heptose 1,7-bisphosphate phosphatase